jgi:putative peptidoglycan lipid II flippase
MIATLLAFGGRTADARLVELLAWGSVAGSLLQLAIQIPAVHGILGTIRILWRPRSPEVVSVTSSFVPVFIGRGVAQLSAFVDVTIASLVAVTAPGAVAALGYGQMLYMLPVSLFGMSVSAAELPAMSSVLGDLSTVAAALRARLETALRRIAFFVVPSAVAFLALGDEIALLIYGSGRFGVLEARWVWAVLAGASVGLVAATLGRLYSSAFYALRDTRTPLRFAIARVVIGASLGATLALLGPRAFGLNEMWGVAGITIGAGVAAWVEFFLLRRALARRIGKVDVQRRALLLMWAGALLAAAVAWAARLVNAGLPDILRVALVLALYGMTYWIFTWRAGIPEALEMRRRVFRNQTRR